MVIGVPKEIKDHETRVGLVPSGAMALREAGHRILVETGAGEGSAHPDSEYRAAGAEILPRGADVWGGSDLVVKVKEPQTSEYGYLSPGLILFTYLHLAPSRELTDRLLESKVTGIAYETIVEADGSLPLLTPMSEVAGRMAVQVGAQYLERPMGGRGVLLAGVPGVAPGECRDSWRRCRRNQCGQGGAGNRRRSHYHRQKHEPSARAGRCFQQPRSYAGLESVDHPRVAEDRRSGDRRSARPRWLLAPKIVRKQMISEMKKGAVVVDVAIDQGGCFETSHPTTHTDPIYFVDGVLHYCVSNMPAAVPHTATLALTNSTFPYLLELANLGFDRAVEKSPGVASRHQHLWRRVDARRSGGVARPSAGGVTLLLRTA